MDIKRIIKEEAEGFDWTDEAKPSDSKYGNDAKFDYESAKNPITHDAVRDLIIQEMDGVVNNPDFEQDVDMLANRIMYQMWERLYYITEEHGDDLNNIASGNYK